MTEQSVIEQMIIDDGNTQIAREEVLPLIEQGVRVYAWWHDQIVRINSEYYLDKYGDEARAFWSTPNRTMRDIIRKA